MPPLTTKRIAVIGGGINGVMTAWRLATLGAHTDLYERDTLMGATSSASTKLLHGGVRYLEQGEFRLVYESLHERTWWVQHAPHLAHPIELLLPVPNATAEGFARSKNLIGLGLTLYDILAGSHTFGRHHWHSVVEVESLLPHLRTDTLAGAYSFFDAQMDDHALGLWAADQARTAGVTIYEHTPVDHITTTGTLTINGVVIHYDVIVNAAGPWAEHVLTTNNIRPDHTLDLVRGSHLLLKTPLKAGVLVQVPNERRICFILPYAGQTLVGTTEVLQPLDALIECTLEEQQYLLNIYNTTFTDTKTASDIATTFAGVRPLLHSNTNPTQTTREYALERHDKLVTIFGGKWTTSRALAARVATLIQKVVATAGA